MQTLLIRLMTIATLTSGCESNVQVDGRTLAGEECAQDDTECATTETDPATEVIKENDGPNSTSIKIKPGKASKITSKKPELLGLQVVIPANATKTEQTVGVTLKKESQDGEDTYKLSIIGTGELVAPITVTMPAIMTQNYSLQELQAMTVHFAPADGGTPLTFNFPDFIITPDRLIELDVPSWGNLWLTGPATPALVSATLSDTPAVRTSATSLDVTVAGNGVTQYRYVLQDGPSLPASCSDSIYPATWTNVGQKITVSGLTEGTKRLCVVGRDAKQVAQTEPSVFEWSIDTTPPSVDVGTDALANTEITRTATTSDAASYQWSKVSGPGAVTFGDANASTTTISVSQDGVYVIRLTASDDLGNAASDEFELTWNTSGPGVLVGADVTTNTEFTKTASATGATSYQWSQVSGPGTITFGTDTAISTTISASATGSYVIRLTVTDAMSATASDDFTLTWDVTPPSVDVGADVLTKDAITKTPTVSGALTYQWTKVSGLGTVTFGTPTASSTTISASITDAYVIRLTATDAAGNSASDEFTLNWDVTPPTVDVGADVATGTETTKTATVTGATTYLWTKESGTGTVIFGTPAAASTTISASIAGTFVIRLTATDAVGNAAYDEFDLTWSPGAPNDGIPPGTPTLDITSKVFKANFDVTVSQSDSDADFTEFRYRTDGNEPTSCTDGTASSGTITISGTSNVTLKVIACDAGGNTSPGAATGTYTYDNTAPSAPTLDITSKVFNADFSVTASQTGSDPNFSFFRYRLDGTAPTDCGNGTQTSGTISITGSSDVSLRVVACDAAGNISAASSGSYTYDNTAPSAPSLSPTSNVFNGSFHVTASQNGSDPNFVEFRYRTDGTDPTSCSDGTSSSGSIPISGTANVSLKVVACDAAGNRSGATTGSYVYDGITPNAPTISPGSTSFVTSIDITLTENGADANFSSFRYRTDGIAPTSCSDGTASTSGNLSISNGSTFTLEAVVCDAAGNRSSASTATYTYDATPPPALTAFSGTAGSLTGSIALTLTYPGSTADYDSIKIYRAAGATAPAACSGTLVTTISNFSTTTYTDSTGSNSAYFSYRACIYDAVGNVTSTNVAQNVLSRGVSQSIFITATTYATNFGGLTAGDAICQSEATSAGLGGKWMAVLSDAAVSAKARLPISGTIYNIPGDVVASSKANFWGGSLTNGIRYTATGTDLGTNKRALTGSTTAGESYANFHCSNWTTISTSFQSMGGISHLTTSGFLQSGSGVLCNTAGHLYCLSKPYDLMPMASVTVNTGAANDGDVDITLQFPADTENYSSVIIHRLDGATAPAADCSNGTLVTTITDFVDDVYTDQRTAGEMYSYRVCIKDPDGNVDSSYAFAAVLAKGPAYRMFTTSTTYNGNLGGISGADDKCQTVATSAGLSGTWKAIISTSTSDAASRIAVNGPVYSVANHKIASGSGTFWGTIALAPNYNETGANATATGTKYAWTGSDAYGWADTTHCSNFTSTASTGSGGNAVGTSNWLKLSALGCNTAYRLYCITQ